MQSIRSRLFLAVLCLIFINQMIYPIFFVAGKEINSSQSQSLLDKANATLNRADEATLLTEGNIEQTTRTIQLMQFMLAFFSILILILGIFGFKTIHDFQQTMENYKKELKEIGAQREKMDSILKEIESTRKAMVLLFYGNKLFDDGKISQSIDAYEEARRFLETDPEINYRLGKAYSNKGSHEDAIKTLEMAIKSNPAFAEAKMELGLAWRRYADGSQNDKTKKEGYKEAELHFKQAVELKPDYEDAWATLGGLYRRERREKEALQSYLNAAKSNPNSSYAMGNIASLYWGLNNHKKAMFYFDLVEDLIKKKGEVGFWDRYDLALANLVLASGDESKKALALEQYKSAIIETPTTENLKSVLDNLNYLKEKGKPIDGITEVVTMINNEISKRNKE